MDIPTPTTPARTAPQPRPDVGRSLATTAGWIGLAGVVTGMASLVVLAGLSRFGDPPRQMVASYRADRPAALAALVLGAGTSVLTVVFIVGLRRLLDRSTGPARFRGDVAVAGALLLFGLVLAAIGLSVAAFVQSGLPGGVTPSTASLLTTASLVLINLSAWPTLAICAALAIGFGREPGIPRWTVVATAVVGALHLGAGVSLAGTGPLAVDGPFAQLAPVAWYVWMLAIAVVVLRCPAVPHVS